MRPYLAIIKDSFRAAFASRVLYVLLGLITVLLVLIAPFHYREVLDWEVKLNRHVQNPESFLNQLMERKGDERFPGAKRIWDSFSDDLRNDLVETAKKVEEKEKERASADDEEADEDESPRARRRRRRQDPEAFENYPVFERMIDELNEIIEDPDFYREEDWDNGTLDEEETALIESGVANLSDERVRRLNRLLVGNAMGSVIQSGAKTALDFYYLIWKIPIFSTNITHQQFASMFASSIPWFFDKFVMSIGLLIAILVTANIIPETFDPGSLNLLLSKPISRWALLLAKFIGGCAFVALCSTYLFLGAWAWLGFGMGIWDKGILFSIPIYILAFAIYYSVSTLVGIWYRSPILSVILTAIFWAVCFLVGYTFFLFDNRMDNAEIKRVIPYQDRVLQVDPLSAVSQWRNSDSDWEVKLKASMAEEQEVGIGIALFFGPIGLPGGLAPVYDEASETLVSGLINLAQGPASFGQQDCFVSKTDNIEFKKLGKFPRDTMELFPTEDGPVAITSSGKLYRFKPGILRDAFSEESDSQSETDSQSSDSEEIPLEDKPENKLGPKELFENFATTKTVVRNEDHVDRNFSNGELAIYRKGEVFVFKPTADGYEKKSSLKIDTGIESNSMRCFVSYQGNWITLVLGNGQMILVDAIQMKEVNGYLPETRSGITLVEASPDGRWVCCLFKNGNLWLLDTNHPDSIKKASLKGQGSISSTRFTAENHLWVADRTDRVTLHDLTDGSELKEFSPGGEWYKKAYRWGLQPLYSVFPKPGELYKVATHLSDTGDTKYNREVDLTLTEETKNPWSPLWSGLGFMAVVLLIACWSFSRKDY